MPRPNRFAQKRVSTPRPENPTLSLYRKLRILYNTLSLIELRPKHNITYDDIDRMKELLRTIEHFLVNHTSVILQRPPLYFPYKEIPELRSALSENHH